MESVEAKIEARRWELQRMGEPPGSQRYLLELEFNGERVVVEAPQRDWADQEATK